MTVRRTRRVVKRKRPLAGRPSPSAILARKIFILFIILVAQLIFYYSDFFKLKEIKVFGNNRVPTKQIIETAGIPMEKNIVTLPLANYKKKLSSIYWIKDSKIKWAVPGQVHIYVSERTPSVLIKPGVNSNDWYAVDESGVVLYKASPGQRSKFCRLVVDTPVNVGESIPAEPIAESLKLDSFITKHQQMYRDNIDYFYFNKMDEAEITFEKDGKPILIKVGKLEDMEQKMKVFGAFMEMLQEKSVPVEYIDLRFKQPVLKPAEPAIKSSPEKSTENND